MNVTVINGVATLPDGTTVDLAECQRALVWAYQTIGDGDFSVAAGELGRLTGIEPILGWLPADKEGYE